MITCLNTHTGRAPSRQSSSSSLGLWPFYSKAIALPHIRRKKHPHFYPDRVPLGTCSINCSLCGACRQPTAATAGIKENHSPNLMTFLFCSYVFPSFSSFLIPYLTPPFPPRCPLFFPLFELSSWTNMEVVCSIFCLHFLPAPEHFYVPR